jgi:hypothetical protein
VVAPAIARAAASSSAALHVRGTRESADLEGSGNDVEQLAPVPAERNLIDNIRSEGTLLVPDLIDREASRK